MGAFGEGSEDLHGLVQLLAESKVKAMGLFMGRTWYACWSNQKDAQYCKCASTVTVPSEEDEQHILLIYSRTNT